MLKATTRSGRFAMYRKPSASRAPDGAFTRGTRRSTRISMRATIIPTNVTALTTNTQPLPTATIMRPATAGPIMRALLKDAALRATAFEAFSRATRSETNACRAGLSNAAMTPSVRAKPYISGSVITPARRSSRAWVSMRRRRRSKRSATHPVTLTRSSCGANCRPIVTPMAAASLFVSSVRTTQLIAVACIHAPMFDTSAPMNQTR